MQQVIEYLYGTYSQFLPQRGCLASCRVTALYRIAHQGMNREDIASCATMGDRGQGVRFRLVHGKGKVILCSLLLQFKGALEDTLGETHGNGSAALQFASQPQEV